MEDKNRGHATLPQGSGASSSSRALPPAKRWRGRISAAQAPAVSDADDSMQDASSSSGVRPPAVEDAGHSMQDASSSSVVRPPAVQDADDNVQSLGSNSVAPAPAPRTRVPKKDAEILAAVRVLTQYPRQLPRGTKPANEEEREENALAERIRKNWPSWTTKSKPPLSSDVRPLATKRHPCCDIA